MAGFVRDAVSAGATGVGAHPDYMGPNGIHVGGGVAAAWGARNSSANAPPWLTAAWQDGMKNRMTPEQVKTALKAKDISSPEGSASASAPPDATVQPTKVSTAPTTAGPSTGEVAAAATKPFFRTESPNYPSATNSGYGLPPQLPVSNAPGTSVPFPTRRPATAPTAVPQAAPGPTPVATATEPAATGPRAVPRRHQHRRAHAMQAHHRLPCQRQRRGQPRWRPPRSLRQPARCAPLQAGQRSARPSSNRWDRVVRGCRRMSIPAPVIRSSIPVAAASKPWGSHATSGRYGRPCPYWHRQHRSVLLLHSLPAQEQQLLQLAQPVPPPKPDFAGPNAPFPFTGSVPNAPGWPSPGSFASRFPGDRYNFMGPTPPAPDAAGVLAAPTVNQPQQPLPPQPQPYPSVTEQLPPGFNVFAGSPQPAPTSISQLPWWPFMDGGGGGNALAYSGDWGSGY